jgi:hypothetical protein
MELLQPQVHQPDANQIWRMYWAWSRSIPGYHDFVRYLNVELHLHLSLDSIANARKIVSNKARLTFDEVNWLPLTQAVAILKEQAHEAAGPLTPPEGNGTPDTDAELPDLVTLDQAAAAVHLKKRGLEHYKTKGMPDPTVEGGGGRSAKWDWKIIRPWLEKEFGIKLPETYPANRNR